jgi:hypothetical protein
MKRNILLLALFVSLSFIGLSNDYHENFYSKNGNVTWERHYQTSDSFDVLIKKVKLSGLLSNIEIIDNYIVGDLKPKALNLILFRGGRDWISPSYYFNQVYNGTVVIKFHQGHYRLVFKNIYVDYLSNTDEVAYKRHIIFESMVLNIDGKFDRAFKKNFSQRLNHNFLNWFDFTSNMEDI